MWRVPNDGRTVSHYKRVTVGGTNLKRVATAWFDKFLVKFQQGQIAKEVAAVRGKLSTLPYPLHLNRKIHSLINC